MSTYKTGAISVTSGSASVSGSGTAWINAVVPGDLLALTLAGPFYEVISIVSDTSIILDRSYTEGTADGQAYVILRLSLSRQSTSYLAGRVQDLLDAYSGALSVSGDSKALTLNKALTANDAMTALQTAGAGRWRHGMIGNDDFRVQRSTDGVTFTDAMSISLAEGDVLIGGNLVVNQGIEAVGHFRSYRGNIYSRSNGENIHYWLERQNGTPAGILFHEVSSGDTILANYNASGDAWLSHMRLSSLGSVTFGDRVGIGAAPGGILGSGSAIAIGDADTGFKQEGEGVLTAYANSAPKLKLEADGSISMFTQSVAIYNSGGWAGQDIRGGVNGGAFLDFTANGHSRDFHWRQYVAPENASMFHLQYDGVEAFQLQSDGNIWTPMFGYLSAAFGAKTTLGGEQVGSVVSGVGAALTSIPSGCLICRLSYLGNDNYQAVYRAVL